MSIHSPVRGATSRKPLVGAATAAAALSLVLAGCAGTGGDTPEDTSLTIVWESGGKDALDAVIAEFEAANPGYTVEPEYLDAPSIQTQMPTRLSAGTAPDVFRTEAGRGTTMAVQYLVSKGLLAELTGENVTAVPESISDTLSVDGVPYGYTPVLMAVGQVFNDDSLAASGLEVPTTWDEVLTFCADARANGTIAFANGPVTLHENQTVPFALAGQLVYGEEPDLDEQLAAGETTFADSPWREAIERELEMVDAGCFPDGFTGEDMFSVIDSISTGRTLGMVGYTGYLPYASKATSTFSLYPLPGSDDPDESRLLVAPFASLSVNAQAANPELAQKFVDFVASPEITELYAATVSPDGGLLASDYLTGTAPTTQMGTTIVEYLSAGKTIAFPDAYWPNPEVQRALQAGVQELVQGKKTVDDVLNAMQEAQEKGTAD